MCIAPLVVLFCASLKLFLTTNVLPTLRHGNAHLGCKQSWAGGGFRRTERSLFNLIDTDLKAAKKHLTAPCDRLQLYFATSLLKGTVRIIQHVCQQVSEDSQVNKGRTYKLTERAPPPPLGFAPRTLSLWGSSANRIASGPSSGWYKVLAHWPNKQQRPTIEHLPRLKTLDLLAKINLLHVTTACNH